MKIFVSFVEADQPIADRIIATLSAEHHTVFARPERLPVGPSITAQTRAAMDLSDRLIFLVSPSSIAAGSVTLSDLTLARAKWPNPKGRVIPVLAVPVEEPSLPSYLKGCDLLTPEGDVASEVANAVAMTTSRRKTRGPASARLAGAAAIAMLAAGAVWLLLPATEEPSNEAALADVEFTVSDDTQLLNWGQLAVYQLTEKRGAGPSTYRCKVGPATSPNIASIKHDESCQKIEIQLSDGPFVDDQQQPYEEGYFKPELDRVPYVITTPSGQEVFQGHIPVLPYNASVAMILEGLPVKDATLKQYEIQSGKSYDLAVGFRSNPMPVGTRCTLSDSSSSFNFTLRGDCRFRLDSVAPGHLALDVERPGGYKLVTYFDLIEGKPDSGAASTTSPAPSPVISSEELKNKYPPELEVFWSDGININVKRVGDLQYVGYEISRDGSSYEAITSISGWRPDEKFLIRISAADGHGALGPMDFTEHVKDAARKELRKIISENAGPLWCTASHCEIKRQSLCNKGWSKLTLGRSPAIAEITYDLQSCPGDPLPYVNYCLSVPGNMPPMKPGQAINGTLYSQAGEPFSFDFETPGALDKNFHSGNSHHFGRYVALEAAEGSESESQPFVLAALSGGISPAGEGVILDIAAGGCTYGLREAFSGWLFDIDGQGFVRGDLQWMTIPYPKKPSISFVLEGKDGRRHGPYSYRIDLVKLFEAQGAGAAAPTLSCQRRACRIPGSASWLRVSEIRYGRTASELTSSQTLSWSRQDILDILSGKMAAAVEPNLSPMEQWQRANEARMAGSGPTIAIITTPTDWSDFYYQLSFRDGSTSIVERIPMSK